MIHPATRVALVLALAGLSLLALRFYRRQNAGLAMKVKGGGISPPKMAWLFFTVYLWFLLCPLAALDPGLSTGTRWVIGAFSVCMWLRGLAELHMLYVTHSWRPPYGVAHDLLCIALVTGGLLWVPDAWPGFTDARASWGSALLSLLLFSLLVETVYATLFFRAVKGRTMGEDGVWFADGNEARFRRINRLTFALNIPQYAALAALVGTAVAGLS